MTLTFGKFDFLGWKLAHRLPLLWETFAPISFSSALFVNRVSSVHGTDRQTDKTRNAAFYDSHIIITQQPIPYVGVRNGGFTSLAFAVFPFPPSCSVIHLPRAPEAVWQVWLPPYQSKIWYGDAIPIKSKAANLFIICNKSP